MKNRLSFRGVTDAFLFSFWTRGSGSAGEVLEDGVRSVVLPFMGSSVISWSVDEDWELV